MAVVIDNDCLLIDKFFLVFFFFWSAPHGMKWMKAPERWAAAINTWATHWWGPSMLLLHFIRQHGSITLFSLQPRVIWIQLNMNSDSTEGVNVHVLITQGSSLRLTWTIRTGFDHRGRPRLADTEAEKLKVAELTVLLWSWVSWEGGGDGGIK